MIEFCVMQTTWRDAGTDTAVVDDKFTLIVRAKKPS